VVDYELVALDPEPFTSMAQMVMCCWIAELQWQTHNRVTVRGKNGELTQPLAIALLSKSINNVLARTHFFLTALGL
jgi:hypothetical protein